MTMKTPNLLPCPFCDGTAETIVGPVPGRWGVRCTECGVWRDDRCDTEAEATVAWNRRADLHAAVVAERDELLSAVNQCRLAFAGYVSVQSAINKIDALAKQEPKE